VAKEVDDTMKFRTTLTAGVLLLLFGLYVYVFEYRWPQEKEYRAEQASRIFSLDGEELKGLKITNSHGTFLLERGGSEPSEDPGKGGGQDWRIVEPVASDADDTVISGLVNALLDLKSEQVATEGPEDLAPFGLKEPKIRIEVLLQGGETVPPALLTGRKNPVGENSYGMKEGEQSVHLLNACLDDSFSKNLYDLREKQIFRVNKNDIEKLEIYREGSPWLEMTRNNGLWELDRPFRTRLTTSGAEKILDRLSGATAQSFDSETSENIDKFGLGKPGREILVTLAPDHTQARLQLGSTHQGPGGEDLVYAKRDDTPGVVSLKGDLLETLDADPEEMREKKVFPLQPWTVDKIHLTVNGQDITVVKKGAGKWWMTEPVEAGADSSVVTPFLSDLSRLEGTAFHEKPSDPEGLKEYGLNPPLAKATLFQERLRPDQDLEEEGEMLEIGTLLLGAPNGPEGVIYACTGDGITVAEVDPEFLLRNLPKSVESLRDKRLLDFYPYQASFLDFRGPGEEVLLERKKDTWKLRKPESREVEEQTVNDLLGFLSNMKSDRILGAPVSEVPEKGRDLFGLDSPKYSVSLKDQEGEDLGTVLISGSGPRDEPGFRYVRKKGDKWIGLIGGKKVEELRGKMAEITGKD
jgi:hypothetical protein